jgi:hypothetical protein
MALYYLSRSVKITGTTFASYGQPTFVANLRDLSGVCAVRRAGLAELFKTSSFKVCTSGAVGFSVVLTTSGASFADVTWLSIAGLSLAMLVALGGLLAMWRRRVSMELWAVHCGEPVCLFRTNDRLLFGQVSRALRRALERLETAHVTR